MRQVLRPGALGRPRGIGWRGRWEGGWGWGIHVYPWLIHVNVWQKPLQYYKVISLQLIKKKKLANIKPILKNKDGVFFYYSTVHHQRLKQMWGSGLCCILCKWSYFSSLRKMDKILPSESASSSRRTRTPTLIKSLWIYLNESEGRSFFFVVIKTFHFFYFEAHY